MRAIYSSGATCWSPLWSHLTDETGAKGVIREKIGESLGFPRPPGPEQGWFSSSYLLSLRLWNNWPGVKKQQGDMGDSLAKFRFLFQCFSPLTTSMAGVLKVLWLIEYACATLLAS